MKQHVFYGGVGLFALLVAAGCSSPGASTSGLVEGAVVSMDPVLQGREVPWGAFGVSVAIDGVRGDPSERAIRVEGATTREPIISFLWRESVGTFRSAVITIREVKDDRVDAEGIFISDFAAEPGYRIVPERAFSLLDPGPGVIVGQGDRTDIDRLEPNTEYQLDLVIQSDGGSKTVPVRFRTGA